MIENIKEILGQFYVPNLNILDIVEILIIISIIYAIGKHVKDTRVLIILKGIGLLALFYVISYFLSFNAILLLFQSVTVVLAIVLVIVFQSEIRKFIENLGSKKYKFSIKPKTKKKIEKISEKTIQEIASACSILSKTKTGALIVIENDIPLNDYVKTGISLNSTISSQLLVNIFEKNTPLHDGAVIIQDNKISSATSYLPLSENNKINKNYGTRHRAAIGVTETTDAVVVIVSEETGNISFAKKGNIKSKLDEELLIEQLKLFNDNTSFIQKTSIKKALAKNLKIKIISIVLGVLSWAALINIANPVVFKTFNNIPIEIANENAISEINKTYAIKSDSEVNVTVKCNRADLEKIKPEDIKVKADFEKLSDVYAVELTGYVSGVNDAEVILSEKFLKVSLEDLTETEYKVQVQTTGTPSEKCFIYDIALQNDTISIKGAQSLIKTIDKVVIDVDVNGVTGNEKIKAQPIVYDKNGTKIDLEKLSLNMESIAGEIKTYKTKEVPVNIQLKPQDILTESAIKSFSINTNTVLVASDDDTLNNLNSFSIEVPITITAEQASIDIFSKNILFKDYVTNDKIFIVDENSSCDISVIYNSEITRTIQIPTSVIKVNNLNKDRQLKFNEDFIEITCTGERVMLAKLTHKDFNCSIDATNVYSGKQNCKVAIDSKTKMEIETSYVPITVSWK